MKIQLERNERNGWIMMRGLPYHAREIANECGAKWASARKVWQYPPLGCCHDRAVKLLSLRGFSVLYSPEMDRMTPEAATLGQDWVHKPYDHQRAGMDRIATSDSYYAGWRMGTGKTKLIVDYLLNAPPLDRVLILCPKSVVPVWPAEFEKHWISSRKSPVVLAPTGGTVRNRLTILQRAFQSPTGTLVVVMNYEAARAKLAAAWLLKQRWDLTVLDEAHRCKQHDGATGKLVDKLRDVSTRRVCLSGTPIPNHQTDIFSQYRFLDPTIFGQSFHKHRERYCKMGGFQDKQIIGYRNEDEFKAKLHSKMDIVRLEDVVDMPPAIDTTIDVTLGKEGRRFYDDLKRDLIAQVEHDGGVVVAANTLVHMLRLQQVTSGCVKVQDDNGRERMHVVDTAKREALADYLDSIDAAEPVVVFCRFTSDIDAVRELAAKLGRYYGELSGKRDDVGGVWKPSPGTVLAVQIASGSAGIDLTAARYAVFMSLGFDLAQYDQARARLVRKGQDFSVVFTHMVASRSIDSYVYKSLYTKDNRVKSLLTPTKEQVTQLVQDIMNG